jgi:hypothetical protein
MRVTKNSITRLIILGCIIPVVLSTIVYYGFSTNYTKGVFTKQGFEQQYENGIYKYRVLGQTMLLKTHAIIQRLELPVLHYNEGDWEFYSAYFYLNTAFLCLTCLTLFFVLGGLNNRNFLAVDLPLLFMSCLMTITQYVVVPYDMLSYFFLSIAALLILNQKQTILKQIVLCIVVILATLTRETASLILAFYFTVHYKDIFKKTGSFKINNYQRELLIITLCFLCTYFGLRFTLGFENGIYQSITLNSLLNPLCILSLLFFISISILIIITKEKTTKTIVFLISTLPYTIPLLGISQLWEIRLWVPVILLLIILKIPNSTNYSLSKIEETIN